MARELVMPVLGMNQDTGTLVRWLCQEGDRVQKGDAVMEIATDKITVEIEAPAAGVLSQIRAQEGEEIPVGQTVALIVAEGETAPARAKPARAEAAAPPASQSPPAASPVARRLAEARGIDWRAVPTQGKRIAKEDVEAYLAQRQGVASDRVLASPKARRLAREQGADLAQIRGSGPRGAVLAADLDVESVPSPAAPAARAQPPGRRWQVMARRLTESWQSIPHFYLARSVDATQLQAWRKACQDKYQPRITLTDLLVKVLGAALSEHPEINASWRDDGAIVRHPEINVGLAVAVPDGLLVPVIPAAQRKAVPDIAAARERLVAAARKGALAPDDMTGGTFTVTNLGMFGVERFGAIINPPEAAILAVGAVRDQVVPVDGQPGVRPVLELTLSCDHRVADGAAAARFLHTLVGYLEAPLLLLD